jgi:protein-disulfide isomerase
MKYIKASFALLWLLSISAYSEETGGVLLGGSAKSPIKIEVFSDFECPHCRELYISVIRPVLRDYSGKGSVSVIYYEFPLKQHKYSHEAARYSEAASRISQEVLLKTYETLFREQADWTENGKLEGKLEEVLSKALPGEVSKMKTILQDPGITAAIKKDIEFGDKNKITGTPTMLISYPPGKQQRVEMSKGPLVYDTLKRFIDSVLNK